MADYTNGSDVLLMIGEKCVGHCTSHTVSYSSETKEHSVKPVASEEKTKALFKGKTVVSLAVSIKFEGLVFDGETETDIKALRAKWLAAGPITCQCFDRGSDSAPYLTGKFVMTALDEEAPAQDDMTYSGTLENDGAVTMDND